MSNKKVIPFSSNEEYRFIVEVCKYTKVYSNNERAIMKHVLIMIERKKNGVVLKVPHPVSEYLLQSTKYKKNPRVNTTRTKAMSIVPFLNYILIENHKKFKVRDIYDLKFEHAEHYLNEYALRGVSRNTLETCERNLKDFYYYLAQKKVLLHHSLKDFTILIDEKKDRRIVQSPFNNISVALEKEQKTILHDFPKELIMPFIDTALDVAPFIALGIYFQFFGGLRIGEVVNIKRTGLNLKGPSGMYGIVVNLKSNNLRTDLKHINNGGTPKKERKQVIFPYQGNILPRLYDHHLKLISGKVKNTPALFVNTQGKAMTDDSYRYYFNKVRDTFCDKLLSSDSIENRNYGIYLKSVQWSSHLGRGIFSNMVAELCPNIAYLRQSRGDSTFDAALTYVVDSEILANQIYENQLAMWGMVSEKVKELLDREA